MKSGQEMATHTCSDGAAKPNERAYNPPLERGIGDTAAEIGLEVTSLSAQHCLPHALSTHAVGPNPQCDH